MSTLYPKFGEEITASFIKFVRSTHLTVADVVNGNYHQQFLQTMNLSEKYATAVGLCNASEKDLPVVRNFVQNYLGQEMSAVYDSLWIRNNPERAAIIAELDEPMTLKMVTSNVIERAY